MMKGVSAPCDEVADEEIDVDVSEGLNWEILDETVGDRLDVDPVSEVMAL